MTQSIYEKVELARKSWTPIQPTAMEHATPGSEDTISRCLSLSILELPVRDFIMDGISRQETQIIGEAGIRTLLRNVEDEERHDIALSNCRKVFADYNASYEAEAEAIADAWIRHPDHPIAKAAVLENGVFFVVLPLYRTFGSPAQRTSAVDISADEALHVRSHRQAVKDMQQSISASLDGLRKATVAWIVEKFAVPGYTAAQFQRASDDLMYKGITSELNFTQAFQVPAFFETHNSNLPYYN